MTRIPAYNYAMDIQQIAWARKDAAAQDALRPDYDEFDASREPLDRSAGSAKSDIDWYQRRGE